MTTAASPDDPAAAPARAVGAPPRAVAAPHADLLRRRVALVIGVDAYAHGISPLRGAAADARAVAATLGDASRLDRYDPVTLLLDGDATREGIARAFESLRAEVASDPLATAIVYFAGHGLASALPEDAATDTPGYLLPSDARAGDASSFVSMRALRGWVDALRCHHLLLVLDCCFAGAFRWAGARSVRASPRALYRERLARYLRDPAWFVLASAAHDEQAMDVLEGGAQLGGRGEVEAAAEGGARSPFAAALVEGLRGEADFADAATGRPDGVITCGELHTWLEHRFSAWEQARGRMQKPMLFPWPGRLGDKGEYVFLNPREALRLESAGELIEASNPYRGFRSYQYTPDDVRFFLGRDALVRSLFGKVTGADGASGEPVVIVVGPSGSGKSSLVAAGLVPRLVAAGWTLLADVARPGDSPMEALRRVAKRVDPYGAEPSLASAVRGFVARDPAARGVLVVDQLEELVTLRREQGHKAAFLVEVEAAVEAAGGRLRVVFTLRSDFEPHFAAELTERRPTGRFRVPPLGRAELRDMIEKPAEATVLGFSPPTLVDEIVEEVVDAPGALPLLSFTLSEMFLHYVREFAAGRRDDRVLTAEDYHQLGRVEGALSRRAEQVFDALDAAGRLTLRRVMLRMVSIRGGQLTRRPVPLAELDFADPENGRVAVVLDALTEARLVVRGHGDDGEFVEPVHDKVVLGWPRLVAWIHDPDERERYDAVQVVRYRTDEWNRLGREGAWVDQDTRLKRWVELAHGDDSPFNADEAAFLRGSRERRDAERERERERVAALQRALTRAQDQLRMIAARDAADDPTVQAALLCEVVEPERTTGWQRLALEVTARPIASAVLSGHGAAVSHAVPSPDGSKVLTASDDGVVRLWEAGGGGATVVFRGPPGPAAAAVFSPDGELVLVAGVDRVVRLLRPDKAFDPRELRGAAARVTVAAFSPDGARVAAGSFDGEVHVWAVRGRTPAVALRGHQGRVRAVRFSADGGKLLSASTDHTALVWREGVPLRLAGHEAEVDDGAFSPDGALAVTASRDGTARVWRLDGSGDVVVLRGHAGAVTAARFSPDGARVVTASADGTARLWRVDGSEEPRTLEGHAARLTAARFSPDGRSVVTASADGTARVWRVEGRAPPLVLAGHGGAVASAGFTADGCAVVTASADRSARVWPARPAGGRAARLPGGDVRTIGFSPDGACVWALGEGAAWAWRCAAGEEPVLLARSSGFVATAASRDGSVLAAASDGTATVWSADGALLRSLVVSDAGFDGLELAPDGSRVAAVMLDNTVRLWATTGSDEGLVLRGHEGAVNGGALSADGKRLVTASGDRTVRIWRLDAPEPPIVLRRDGMGTQKTATFQPDGGGVVAVSYMGTVRSWQLRDGAEPVHLHANQGLVESVAFSPRGTYVLVTRRDGVARVGRTDAPAEPFTLQGRVAVGVAASFSPDGARVASVSESGVAHLWPVDGGPSLPLEGHRGPVTGLAFSPDGTLLATASRDGTARIWRCDGRGDPLVLAGHGAAVVAVAFSPDGARLATATEDGELRMWPVSIASLHDSLRRATTYRLPPEERARRLGEGAGVDDTSGGWDDAVARTGGPTRA